MRLTLITIGSRGDVQPVIPLALGLQRAGFEVSIATHGPYEEFVRGYGLGFYPLAGDPHEMMAGEGGLQWLETGRNPLTFLTRLRDLAIDLFDQLGRDSLAACENADAVLFSTLAYFVAAPVAEKLGIPSIGAYLQPINTTSAFPGIVFPELPESLPLRGVYNRLTHRLLMDMSWRLFGEAFNRVRTGLLGLPPETRSFNALMKLPFPLVYGYSRHVIPKPADWGDHIEISGYWFLDDDDWQPPADLVDFLDAGSRPVYVGFGSMTNRDAERLTDLMLAAIQRSGQRAVLLSGWAGIGSSDLPDTIYRIDYAPHSWLFPRVAAVAHHGGAGTTAAGLRAGRPSVLVPHFADQPFWARQVVKLGVGPRFIPQKQLTAEKLAYSLHVAATNAPMQQRATALGEQIRAEDGVGNAVRYIQRTLETSSLDRRETHAR